MNIISEIKNAIKNYYSNLYLSNDDELKDIEQELVDTAIELSNVYTEPYKGGTKLYVSAEEDYEGLTRLTDYLDPIIKEYDKDAYFDLEEPGIASAVLNLTINEDFSNSDVFYDLEGESQYIHAHLNHSIDRVKYRLLDNVSYTGEQVQRIYHEVKQKLDDMDKIAKEIYNIVG